jgi:hypothetical protein
MEMPKPGPGHQLLESFTGNWKGEETMHPSQWDPRGGVAQATMATRSICDGFYAAGDYEQRRGGAVTFRGHSVLGFDQESQEYVLHWFDSMGMGEEVFRGKLAGQTLALTSKNPMGHNRLTYDLTEKGTLRSKMEMSDDGKQWKVMFDGIYHKQ